MAKIIDQPDGMIPVAERRRQHALWAKYMAEQYRRDAANTTSEYWRNKWLRDASNMDFEAAWAERSTEYMQ